MNKTLWGVEKELFCLVDCATLGRTRPGWVGPLYGGGFAFALRAHGILRDGADGKELGEVASP